MKGITNGDMNLRSDWVPVKPGKYTSNVIVGPFAGGGGTISINLGKMEWLRIYMHASHSQETLFERFIPINKDWDWRRNGLQ